MVESNPVPENQTPAVVPETIQPTQETPVEGEQPAEAGRGRGGARGRRGGPPGSARGGRGGGRGGIQKKSLNEMFSNI